ncbi:MAG: MATE family efflux transporter [Oscillospiraceae bacterium]|nr:MATE family efflux transporter [Oscillospiraceae bacterium]
MARTKTMISDFTQGSIPKQLLIFALPLFFSSLLQVVYNMVDMIVVEEALGKVGLSAVAIGGDVSHFLTFFIMGFSNAGSVIISQYVGAKRKDELGKFICTMFSFLAVCSVVLSIVCIALRHPILRIMNTPTEAYDEALAYSCVSIIGLLFVSGYNAVSAVLRGIGDSIRPFIFISIAAVLNIVLDIRFVLYDNMGAGGAALATVISQGFSFVLCVIYLYIRREHLGFEIDLKDLIHIDFSMLKSLINLGIPMAIKSAAISFSRLFVNSWINSYGVAVSAFSGIAAKIASIANLISNSLNTAGSSLVGQNIGAKKHERVLKIVLTVFGVTFAICAVLTVIMFIFPEQIYSLFTDDAEVMKVAIEFLPVLALWFLGSALRAPSNALINGSGNHKVNFATAILDGIILRIGLSVLFGLVFDMGYMGFWLGDGLAGLTPFFIGVVYYFSGAWKKTTVISKDEE